MSCENYVYEEKFIQKNVDFYSVFTEKTVETYLEDIFPAQLRSLFIRPRIFFDLPLHLA